MQSSRSTSAGESEEHLRKETEQLKLLNSSHQGDGPQYDDDAEEEKDMLSTTQPNGLPNAPSTTVINKSSAELAPETAVQTYSIYDLRQKELFTAANHARVALLRELQTTYAKVIVPGHSPALFDGHKERHRRKTQIALELVALCNTPFNSLEQVKEFITHVSSFKQQNITIDPKGHRLAAILETVNHEKLASEFYSLIRDKREMIEHMLIILCHLKALNLEEMYKSKSEYSVSIKPNDEYHLEEIIRFRNLLIDHYAKELSAQIYGDKLEPKIGALLVKQTSIDKPEPTIGEVPISDYAKELAHRYNLKEEQPISMVPASIKIHNMLDLIQDAVTTTSDQEEKIKLIDECLIPYIIAKAELAILIEDGYKISKASPQKSTVQFVNTAIMLSIVDSLKFAEKPIFWKLYNKVKDDDDEKIYPTFRDSKLRFYLESLKETYTYVKDAKHQPSALERYQKIQEDQDNRQIQQIMEEEKHGGKARKKSRPVSAGEPKGELWDFKDLLNTLQLVRDLKSLIPDSCILDTAELKNKICKIFADHKTTYLNPIDFENDDKRHQKVMVLEWRNELDHITSNLLSMLDQAHHAIKHGVTQETSPLVAKAMTRAQRLYPQTASPSVSAAAAVISPSSSDINRSISRNSM